MLVGELGLQLLEGTKNGLTLYEGSLGSYFQLLKENKKEDEEKKPMVVPRSVMVYKYLHVIQMTYLYLVAKGDHYQ